MRFLAIPLIFAISPQTGMAETFDDAPPPGTYRTVTVSDPAECAALCNNDSDTCRGAQSLQPDITVNHVICYLNDGLETGSPFEIKPPEPLQLDIAVADLNAYRAQYNLPPVRLNARLNAASQTHAEDMARHGMISHSGTDGSSHSDRVQRKGYVFSIAAENVASGQNSWEKVFKAWQESPGHNENLLRNDVEDFGVALVFEPTTRYKHYWAMLLASPLEDIQ